MAKTRFTEEKRNIVHDYMMEQYDAKNKDAKALAKMKDRVVKAINVVIRKKYPEAEMVVLRKYNLTRTDRCLKLVDSDTNAVFGIELRDSPYWDDKDDEDYQKWKAQEVRLADLPYRIGCNSQDVYPIDPKGHQLIEEYLGIKETSEEKRKEKYRNYKSFLAACRYVEDAHEVVPFPKEMQIRLFSGASIVYINPEILAGIKEEFKDGN